MSLLTLVLWSVPETLLAEDNCHHTVLSWTQNLLRSLQRPSPQRWTADFGVSASRKRPGIFSIVLTPDQLKKMPKSLIVNMDYLEFPGPDKRLDTIGDINRLDTRGGYIWMGGIRVIEGKTGYIPLNKNNRKLNLNGLVKDLKFATPEEMAEYEAFISQEPNMSWGDWD